MRKSFFILILLLVTSRFFFLGSDLPNRGISWYTMGDSFYYTSNAFDLYHTGDYHPKDIPFKTIRESFELFQKVITYLSLLLWGNTLFGFLFPTVLLSLVVIYFTWKSLTIVNPNSSLINYIALLYLTTDFYFLLSSRVQSPIIYSMFGISVYTYLLIKFLQTENADNKLLPFLIGLISFGSILFIYIYTVFVFLAVFTTLFIVLFIQRKKYIQFSLFLLGSISSILIFNFSLYFLADMTIIDLFHGFIDHGGNGVIKGESLTAANELLHTTTFKTVLFRIAEPLIAILDTNFFRFNLSLLLLFLISIPFIIKDLLKKKTNNYFILFSITVLFFCYLQCTTGTYFYQRKLAMLLPLILLIVSSAAGKLAHNKPAIESKSKKMFLALYFLFSLLTVIYIFWLTTSSFYGNFSSDFPGGPNTSPIFNYINWGICVLVFAMSSSYIFFRKNLNFISKGIALLIIVPGILLSLKYIYLDRTYIFKNSMVELNKKLENKKVAGGNLYQIMLYNHITPLHDAAMYINKPEIYDSIFHSIILKGEAQYTVKLFYGNKEKIVVNDTIKNNSDYFIVADEVLKLSPYGLYACIGSIHLTKPGH